MEKAILKEIAGLKEAKKTVKHFYTEEIKAIDCAKLCVGKGLFEGVASFFPKEEKEIKIEAEIKTDEIIFGVEVQNVEVRTDEVIAFERKFLEELIKSINFTILFTATETYNLIMQEYKKFEGEPETRIRKVFESVGRILFENDYEKIKERRFEEKKIEYTLKIEL